jgi:hypothetical protein
MLSLEDLLTGFIFSNANSKQSMVSTLQRAKHVLELLASCLIYSLIIMAVTLVVILVLTRELDSILLYLTYGLLIEGGLALAAGGANASFSAVIGKIGQSVFRSAPWDAKRVKEAEKQARVWILTGAYLFFFGLLVSSL